MQKNEFEFIVKFQVEKKVPNFFLDSDTFLSNSCHFISTTAISTKGTRNKFLNPSKTFGSPFRIQLIQILQCTAQAA